MRFLLLAAILLATGCSSGGIKRPTHPETSIPKTHKPPTLSQRRELYEMQHPKAIAGQTKVEGALLR